MRRTLYAASLLLAVACGSSPPPATKPLPQTPPEPSVEPADTPAPAVPAAPPSTVTLPATKDPVVNVAVWFAVGSADDPPGKEGLAWLTAQMIVRGATATHRYDEILTLLYPMATDYAISVDREMTVLSGRAHKDHIDAYLALFNEAFTRPAFAPDDFERLKAETLAAVQKRLRYALDEELGKAALYAMLFDGTGYAHPPQGLAASLGGITVDDVRAFWRDHYTGDRTTFGIAGGWNDATRERLEAARAALPAKVAPAPRPAPPTPAKLAGRTVLLVHKPGADASISFGAPIAVRRGDPDFPALYLAASWLGEHRSSVSHLYRVIRGLRGLNYGDYAYVEAFPNGGFRQSPPPNAGRSQQIFEVWIRTLPNDNAVFALRAALREVDQLVREGMSKDDFELIRSFLRKYLLEHTPSTHDRLLWALDDRYYHLEAPHLESLRKALETLTLEQVNAAIKRHISTENLAIAIATGDPQKLRDALVKGEPTRPTYPTAKPKAILDEDEIIAATPLAIREGAVRVVPVDEMFEKSSR